MTESGYKTYSEFLAEKFPGVKVQKISINAGFSCPNRDGTIGRSGCIYCNNKAFAPSYAFEAKDVHTQLERGKKFFSRKYPEMKYLAYFQSFTNTFGTSINDLEAIYQSAVDTIGISGIIIGTRPDCISPEIGSLLENLNRKIPVIVEFGAETFNDKTLLRINRGHSASKTIDAVKDLSSRGISTGLHLIFGLPGESRKDMLDSVRKAVSLPIETLKFHHMQIIDNTPLSNLYNEGKLKANAVPAESDANEEDITIWDVNNYIEFCLEVINIVPRRIAIERFTASAPSDLLVAPRWGLKNYQFTNLLNRSLRSGQKKNLRCRK